MTKATDPHMKAARQKVRDIRARLPHKRPTTAAKVLENAIAIFSVPRSWGRGAQLDPNTGKVCLLGSLFIADGGVIKSLGWDGEAASFIEPKDKNSLRAFRQARDAVTEEIPTTKGMYQYRPSIMSFNDLHAEGSRDVVRVLKRALKRVTSQK